MGKDTIIKVLVIGNNPIELNRVADQLNEIPDQLEVVYAFDFEGVKQKLLKYEFDAVLLDDNLGDEQLKMIIDLVNVEYQLPISLLKTENKFQKTLIVVDDYLMKVNLTTKSLINSINLLIRFSKIKLKSKAKKHLRYLKIPQKESLGQGEVL